jgi:polygalacturonase
VNGAGGGRVVVPSGTFLTGAIHLKSNVNLFVAEAAALRFSTNPQHYLPVVLTSWEGNDCYNYSPLIYAYKQTNIAVTGPGTLDGQASSQNWYQWVPKPIWGWKPGMPRQGSDSRRLRAEGESGVPVKQRVYGAGHYLRPSFIEFHSCSDALVDGVRIRNSPFWTLHPLFSVRVTIRYVDVRSNGPNDDGCDPECCNDVHIHHCHFDTKDDNIAIKSGRGRDGIRRATPSQNIVIRSVRVSQGVGAIAIGSEQASGVKNVYVDGLTGDDPRLSTGVLIKAQSFYGAGTVEQVYMRNYGGTSESGPYRPVFRDIDLSGFTTSGSRNALNLRGFPDDPIGSVRVSGCRFDNVSANGIIRQNVRGLKLTDVTINGKPVSI